MRNQKSFPDSSVRDGAWFRPRSTRRRSITCLVAAGALALVTTVQSSTLFAADDIQQIKLGPHTFYIPKAWMTRAGVTAYFRSQGMVQKPQPTAIEADSVSFRPGKDWQQHSKGELPDFIHVTYLPWRQPAQTGSRIKTADRQLQKWMTEAARLTPDQYEFVRVEAYGIFLYQPSLNNPKGPLVVQSTNIDLIPGHRLSSFVNFFTNSTMGGQYRFDNTKFPESTWWDLYQRVLAFIDYLQTPK